MAGVNVDIGAKDAGFSNTLKQINNSIDKLEKNTKQAGSSMKTSFSSMAAAGAALAVGFGAIKLAITGIKSAVGGIKDAIENASNLNETITKTSAIFEDGAGEIEAWAETASTSFGQSKQQALDAAGTFAIFGKSAGLSSGELAGFSKELVELSADLASFYNSSPEEAIVAIGAALRGEAEPIRRFNVLMDDATLRQEALKMGIISTTKTALTPQQKVLAAHALIMNQTAIAQGDFANTSDGLANQQRILAAQITNVSTRIGQAFLPAAQELVTFINVKIVPAVNAMMDAFSGKTSFREGIKPLIDALSDIKARVHATAIATSEFLVTTFGPGSSMFIIIKEGFTLLGDSLGLALLKGLKPIFSSIDAFKKEISWMAKTGLLVLTAGMSAGLELIGSDSQKAIDTSIKKAENAIGDSTNRIKNIIQDGDIISDFEKAGAAFPVTFDREYNRLNPAAKVQEVIEKMKKLEAASAAAMAAIARINPLEDIALKIGGQRISNAERIKELEVDIKDAKAQGNTELALSLEASKAYYEQLDRSLTKNKSLEEAITDATKARQTFLDGVLDKQQKVTKELKEQLSLATQMMAKIAEAEAKDKIDPGGKLEKRINDAMGDGNTGRAMRLAERLLVNEQDEAIQDAFGGDNGGFNKSLTDIAKDLGINRIGKSSKELREEILRLAEEKNRKAKEEKDNDQKKKKDDKDDKEKGRKDDQEMMKGLSDLVKDIKMIVAKIEPKLPQHALI